MFTVLIITILVRINAKDDFSQSVTISEYNGVYDLTGIDFDAGITAFLKFNDLYYPNTYLMPGDTETEPTSGKRQDEIRAEYLSHRVVVEMPPDKAAYALELKIYTRHAFRIYVNGELTAQAGVPGTTKRDTEVWDNRFTCYVAPDNDGQMDIIVHCAQFYRNGQGSHTAHLFLSKVPAKTAQSLSDEEKGLIMMGILLCASVVMFSLFVLSPGTRATLYFALACAAIALRECSVSGAWKSFSFLPGNIAFMLEYLSIALLSIFMALYLAELLVSRIGRILRNTLCAVSGFYVLCVLFTDSQFYTWLLTFHQILLFGGIVCAIIAIFWKLRRPNAEQTAALYGIAVFAMAAVLDILMWEYIWLSGLPNVPIMEIAMIVFVLAQEISLFMMNNRMVAEARESERRLAGDKEILVKTNRLKTEFLGNVSHEMRTPLTVISVNVQTVLRLLNRMNNGENDPETDKLLRNAQREIMRLSRMVGGMLTLASISDNTEKSKITLTKILQSAADMLVLFFSERKNELRTEIGEELTVFGDADLLFQVVLNLLQNAHAHTENDIIRLRAVRDGGTITVTVKDNGSGISSDLLPRVFERGVSGKDGDGGGTGYGLFLCKTVVESHGGEIWIESEQGKGTTVYFTLPVYEGQFGGDTI